MDGHTVDTVVTYGTALNEGPGRIGDVTSFGLDEVLSTSIGLWHRPDSPRS